MSLPPLPSARYYHHHHHHHHYHHLHSCLSTHTFTTATPLRPSISVPVRCLSPYIVVIGHRSRFLSLSYGAACSSRLTVAATASHPDTRYGEQSSPSIKLSHTHLTAPGVRGDLQVFRVTTWGGCGKREESLYKE
ncbi:hypothetical protein E2C01_015727 [Portunus trituberculatus]|uniref:Uncharacterized protein n=1 Tax=Portunus trituberculatus TaxID=210409 RepID=A0A5B7DP58_PORTR|nr:hypothetical protein [Portunus trituberculatus]